MKVQEENELRFPAQPGSLFLKKILREMEEQGSRALTTTEIKGDSVS